MDYSGISRWTLGGSLVVIVFCEMCIRMAWQHGFPIINTIPASIDTSFYLQILISLRSPILSIPKVQNCTNNQPPNQIAESSWMRSNTVSFRASSIVMPKWRCWTKLRAAKPNTFSYCSAMLAANFARCTAIGQRTNPFISYMAPDRIRSMNLCSISFSSEYRVITVQAITCIPIISLIIHRSFLPDTIRAVNAFRRYTQNTWRSPLMRLPYIIHCGRAKK